MYIQVNGKHIDVGDALRSHVEDRLAHSVAKYFDRTVDATVTFSRDRHAFKCDASVHLSTGLNAQAQATENDIYAAFDRATERVEKQIRRYKRRIKDHHQNRQNPIEAFEAQSYIIAANDDETHEEPDNLQPVIIAEMKTDIPSLSVGEAVMQMELADRPFLMFKNDANECLNIVYRRDDGNIGWVDPANLSVK